MKSRRALAFLLPVVMVCVAQAGDAPRMSRQTRMDLIRAFTSELVYIRTPFPMGKKGLTLKDGGLTPSGDEIQQLIAMWGPAVKPGDRAMISAIQVKDDRIRFEINGGPVKKQKWYQRIQVGAGGSMTSVAPSDPNANPRGSYVDLVFDHYVPEMKPDELKDLLRPVFDFNAKSPVEAYLETVPSKAKEAIQKHEVLVGMNREMVIYAKGRPPNKTREKDGETEYEEWIYGQPPQDVDFVRFVGDEVVRVEVMKVNGEKVIRTEKELELQPVTAIADQSAEQPRAPNAPSLKRPGEDMPDNQPVERQRKTPVPLSAPPDNGPGNGPPSAGPQ
ncbi:MAG: hypothetical protein JST79_02415 [Acidobacteria bacterium]|nr:hypothetical protein [Acidobacteriota bacterium]